MWINALIPRGSHCKYSSSLRRRFWSKCGCVIDTAACFLRKLSAAIPRRQPSGPTYSPSSWAWASYAKHWENKTFCITSALKGFGVGNHDMPCILFCICACYASWYSVFILCHRTFCSETCLLRFKPWNLMSQIFFWGVLQKQFGITQTSEHSSRAMVTVVWGTLGYIHHLFNPM